jgi:hypothetical protein
MKFEFSGSVAAARRCSAIHLPFLGLRSGRSWVYVVILKMLELGFDEGGVGCNVCCRWDGFEICTALYSPSDIGTSVLFK